VSFLLISSFCWLTYDNCHFKDIQTTIIIFWWRTLFSNLLKSCKWWWHFKNIRYKDFLSCIIQQWSHLAHDP
jgi:hypothetical protein